jgi:signal transduction histidine kinase
MNKINFDIEDILQTYELITKENTDKADDTIGLIHHELLGSYNRVGGLMHIVGMDNPNNHDAHTIEKIKNYGQTTKDALNTLSKHYTQNLTEKEETLKTCAKTILENVKAIDSEKPLEKIILDKSKINNFTKEILTKANSEVEEILKKHNNIFAKKDEEYMLARQILSYVQKHNESKEIFFNANPEAELISKFDYFNNIIVPIIDNIRDHAYNPNIINKIDYHEEYRRNIIQLKINSDFAKKCEINTHSDVAEKTIIIKIQDNGFGMTKEIQEKLFEKGTTSRDEKEGHGIGLHYVKKVLEDKGGKINFLSYLGIGTLFKITIPYDKKEDYTTFYKN